MSTLPDSDFDLNELFQPAWAKEPSALKYAKYEGETERFDRRGDRDRRGPDRPVVTARPGRGGTAIARAATSAVRPDRAAARPGPKASAAGLSAAPDQIFAGATFATSVRPLRRCRKST